jgi:hypothetical protein
MESWCFLNCGVIAPGFCLANLIPLAEANGNSYEDFDVPNMLIWKFLLSIKVLKA